MNGCVFCKIVAREAPAEILHSTESVMAFRDANPQAPTHLLIVPKEHIDSIDGLSDAHADLLAHMFQAANHLAKTEGLEEGWRLVSNVGPAGGQTVYHLHFHLLGGRRMTWPPG
ncbi:MAG: histidine triad nucleotide-binding protein [Actinobacteria bacterium]|nr:histidine triad nucleotide-binding protein [Actinomycetota bacterium]